VGSKKSHQHHARHDWLYRGPARAARPAAQLDELVVSEPGRADPRGPELPRIEHQRHPVVCTGSRRRGRGVLTRHFDRQHKEKKNAMSETIKYVALGGAALAAFLYRGKIADALGLGTTSGPPAIASGGVPDPPPPPAYSAPVVTTPPAPAGPPPPTFTIPTAAELTAASAVDNTPEVIAQSNAWEWNWYFQKLSFYPPGTDFGGFAAYAGWDTEKLATRGMTAATFINAMQNYLTSKGLARGLAGIAIAHLANRQRAWR
jgi:hypothetical protein